jgi:hypothetical protein
MAKFEFVLIVFFQITEDVETQQQMSDSVYIQFVKNSEIVKRNKIPAFPRRRVLSSLLFRVEHVLARDYYIYRCH